MWSKAEGEAGSIDLPGTLVNRIVIVELKVYNQVSICRNVIHICVQSGELATVTLENSD